VLIVRWFKGRQHGKQTSLKAARVSIVLLALGTAARGGAGAAAKTTATSAPDTSLTTTAPPSTTAACSTASQVAAWPLARRSAQLVVVPAEETDVSEVGPSVTAGVGGIILFGSSAPSDLKSELSAVEASDREGVAPFVMTDEEGGEVQRMSNLVGSLPWPATMAQTMTVSQVQSLAEQTAARMAANGITMDLAPVLDLATGPGPDVLHADGPRSFSPVASTATSYGLAFAQGLQAGGVIPVVKHFPGEGSATANTDSAPAATPPLSVLESGDLLPFEAAVKAGLPAVMVGNASVPGLTSQPSSLSPAVVTGLLRRQLGFQGLVITDSLSAGAISAEGLSIPQASVEALEAGADMVLFTSSEPNTTTAQVVSAIASAVDTGAIPMDQLNASVERVLALKKVGLCD